MAEQELFDGEVITELETDDNIAVQKADPSSSGSKVISWSSFKTFLQTYFVTLGNVAQTILGVKTFSSSPLVPDPTTNLGAVNLRTLNNKIGTQGLQMQFDALSDLGTNPGQGFFRFDSLTQSEATKLYINSYEYDSGYIDSLIGVLRKGAIISLKQKGDRAKYFVFEVTSVTDNTGWYTVDVTLITNGDDFEDDDVVNIFLVNDRGDIYSEDTILTSPEDETVSGVPTKANGAFSEIRSWIISLRDQILGVASASGQIQITGTPLLITTTETQYDFEILADSDNTDILQFDTDNQVTIYKVAGRYKYVANIRATNTSTSTDHTLTANVYDASDDSLVESYVVPIAKNTSNYPALDNATLDIAESDVPLSLYVKFLSSSDTAVTLNSYTLDITAGAIKGEYTDTKVVVSENDTVGGNLTDKETFGEEFDVTIENAGGDENRLITFLGRIYNAARDFYHLIESTADAIYTLTLPNKSGTIALTSDLSSTLDSDGFTPVVYADSPYSMAANGSYTFDTTDGIIVANLPTTPSEGDFVYLYFSQVDDTNVVTLDAGTNTIESASTIDIDSTYLGNYYIAIWDGTSNWDLKLLSNTDSTSSSTSIASSSADSIRSILTYTNGADQINSSNNYLYEYDSTSTGTDDGTSTSQYLRPINITSANPGRWIKRGVLGYNYNDAVIYMSDETTDLTTDNDISDFPIDRDCVLNKLIARVTTAPIGSDLVIDVLLDGESIGDITIAAGTTESEVSINDDITAGSFLSLDLTTVGATIPGIGLKVSALITLS